MRSLLFWCLTLIRGCGTILRSGSLLAPPLAKWFKKEMRDLLLDHVNELELAKHGLFDIDEAMKMRDDYIEGRNVNHRKIWNILVFQIWYNRYFATEPHVTYSQTKRSVSVTA